MSINFRHGRVTNRSRHIVSRIQRRKRQLLGDWGRNTRENAREILTTGGPDESAAPGRPAKVHSSEPSLETVLYAVDASGDRVTAGPIAINNGRQSGPPVPGLLEKGGRVVIQPKRRKGNNAIRRTPERPVVAVYEPRPFMRPAAIKATKTFTRDLARKGLN